MALPVEPQAGSTQFAANDDDDSEHDDETPSTAVTHETAGRMLPCSEVPTSPKIKPNVTNRPHEPERHREAESHRPSQRDRTRHAGVHRSGHQTR